MERPTPLGFNDRQIPEAIRMVFTVKPVHFCVYVQSTMETVVTTLFNGITGAVAEGLPQQEHHWAILAVPNGGIPFGIVKLPVCNQTLQQRASQKVESNFASSPSTSSSAS